MNNKTVLTFSFLLLVFCSFPVWALEGQNTMDIEQAKKDYRLFLQKLKELNTEYKQVTGEMAKVVKEEGVPSWDNGDLDSKMAELFPQENPAPEMMSQGVSFRSNDQALTVSLDMPGLKKDSIKISVQDGKKLIVSAVRKDDFGVKKLEKSIELPSVVNPKGAQASYEDGVLTVKLTKISSQEAVIPLK